MCSKGATWSHFKHRFSVLLTEIFQFQCFLLLLLEKSFILGFHSSSSADYLTASGCLDFAIGSWTMPNFMRDALTKTFTFHTRVLSPVSGCSLVFFAAWLLTDGDEINSSDNEIRYRMTRRFSILEKEQGSLVGAMNAARHSSLWQSVSLIPACFCVWMNVVLIYWWWDSRVWEWKKKSSATAEKRIFSKDRITIKCFIITSKFVVLHQIFAVLKGQFTLKSKL